MNTELQTTVETACPLDCPDSCSLAVSTQAGRIVKIDGSHRNEITQGYICAKVRRFGERVHGDLRLVRPMVRIGPKGAGHFEPRSWDEVLDLVSERMVSIRDAWGAEAILPFCYGGSNGMLTQDSADAWLFRRFGTSRLARTACAAPTGAAHMALYGKMPGTSYLDYPAARLIVLWGVNPSASGIHLVPYVQQARRNGAYLVVIDPRTTPLARQADLHLAIRPGTDVAIALAIHRYLFENGLADAQFLDRYTTGGHRLRERAADWTIERAASVAGVDPGALETFAEVYSTASPALIRCGWGLERNRNGGNAAMAVLALPAVAGKFGIRGGGYSMSCSAAWSLDAAKERWIDAPEPSTRVVNMNQLGRALTQVDDPPVKMLFVYNCNPAATMPDQNRILHGLARDDLFTVVFDQVATDTVAWADVVLPATTFLEGHDFAKAYGAFSLQVVEPVIEPVGEARTNIQVFAALCARLGLLKADDPVDAAQWVERIYSEMPDSIAGGLRTSGRAEYPEGPAPVQFIDLFPRTADGKIHLYPEELEAAAPTGLYSYQRDPASKSYPLTLISPASDRAITSTLYELVAKEASLEIHTSDAEPRSIVDGDGVRVFNDLGEVRCRVAVTTRVRPGTVSLPKGLWRKHTRNGSTANALAPDTLTDLGGGACFNDARVEVEKTTAAEFK